MYRIIMKDLMDWYERKQDRILRLRGAKGVGKTWAMLDFGQGFYKKMFYVNFEKDEAVYALFKQGSRIQADKLIVALGVYCEASFEEGETVFVFDEAWIYPKAMDAIMALKQQRPDIPVCIIASQAAGIVSETDSDDRFYDLFLYPMTFEEFLIANSAQNLCTYIENQKLEPITPEIVEQITEYLNVFYITGGMPAVVQDYIINHDLDRVDTILKALLVKCKEHIDRYVPKACALKVNKIWKSIPYQMEKDNRKFMYQYVDEKARAREYEKAVGWLVDTGLVRRVNRIRDGIVPLQEQVDEKSFELYHLDHGLLRSMCGVAHDQIDTGGKRLDDINGALLEQFVLAELTMNHTVKQLYFWISGATARVEFVFEENEEIVPVHVQSQVKKKAQSVKVFQNKYESRMAIRISWESLSFSKGVLNIPLYGLWSF